MDKKIFKILGMKCKSCAKVIKFGLEEQAGIKSVDVDYDSAKAFLEFNAKETNSDAIKNIIKGLGYGAVE